MKKILAAGLALFLTCSFVGLSACGEDHVHTYEEGWLHDEHFHWRKATCGDIEIGLKTKHNYVDGVCTLCGYVDPDYVPPEKPERPTPPEDEEDDPPVNPPEEDNPSADDPPADDPPEENPPQEDPPQDEPIGGSSYVRGEAELSDGILYTELFDGSELVGYSFGKGETPPKGSLTIPDSFRGKPVLEVDEFGFENCTEVSAITLPKTLEFIGFGAFSGCTGITELHIPESVKSIDMQAFRLCSNLVSVDLPKIEVINYELFYKCTALKTLVIPEGVTSIEKMAFYGCRALVDLTLPSTIKSIGKEAFNACEISKVTVADVNLWSVVDFAGDACCPLRDSLELYEGEKLIKELKIDAEKVSDYAFRGCWSIQKVVLSPSVKSIGRNAFSDCRALKELELSEGLKSIGSFAFYSCYALESVVLPDSVETIEEEAFMFCQSLKKFVFGRGIKLIANYVLGNNHNSLKVYYRGTEAEWKSVTKAGAWGRVSAVEFEYNE